MIVFASELDTFLDIKIIIILFSQSVRFSKNIIHVNISSHLKIDKDKAHRSSRVVTSHLIENVLKCGTTRVFFQCTVSSSLFVNVQKEKITCPIFLKSN